MTGRTPWRQLGDGGLVVVAKADPDLLAVHALIAHPMDQVFDGIERRGQLADCPSCHGCATWLASGRDGLDEVFADGVNAAASPAGTALQTSIPAPHHHAEST